MDYTILIICLLIILSLEVWDSRYVLPKIVWIHWDTHDLPELCRLNMAQTRSVLHDWTVIFLTTADFLQMCLPPPEFYALSAQHKADFIRLWLLRKHGGVWMDISIILNQSINDIYDECVREQAELSGFYNKKTTRDPKYPVFENWFIMAPRDSRIIRLWYREYYKAVVSGFVEYKREAKSEAVFSHRLFHSSTDENPAGNDDDVYLTQHLCFQSVIQKRAWNPHILYRSAQDTMFYIHEKCNWSNQCMNSALNSDIIYSVPYIKLIGSNRPAFPLDYFKHKNDGSRAGLKHA